MVGFRVETLLGDSDGVNTFSLDEDVEKMMELLLESSMKMTLLKLKNL